MKLRVQLPFKATEKSLRVCFESILRQWNDRSGIVRQGLITDNGWLELIIGEELDSGELGYFGSTLSQLRENNGIMSLTLEGCTADKLSERFNMIIRKVNQFETEKHGLAEIRLMRGNGICFELFKADWQPAVSENRFNVPLGIQASIIQPDVIKKEKEIVRDSNSSNEKDKQTKLLLIDGMNILSRCYYATSYGNEESDLMRSSKGLFTNGIKPLSEKLVKMIRKLRPTHIAVLWESPGGRSSLWRRKVADFYKSNRDGKEQPASLTEQVKTAKALFGAMNIKQMHLETMEADDLMGCLSKRWSVEVNEMCYLWTNDSDFHQLIDNKTVQLIDDEPFTLEMFNEKYEGITPTQFIDYKGFCGDSSDNIKGIPGIGHKGAIGLLQTYNSMEDSISAAEHNNLDVTFKRYKNKLLEGKDSGLLSRKLATIMLDIREMKEIPWEDLASNFSRSGFLTMLKELDIEHKKNMKDVALT
ncbi:hypothetical protein IAQ67_14510 [Paenibacillus peoriae]|uniref:5'-3' exonuclease n=1 Tax=Paenibacillus peoriae TaxID=59893 RepID=A0A7H0Y220_9BACL|nr:5'-3' exonuclease H3TH domain-containing protein [Paenibacillus peoriae]QNR65128.1 hypothetical protein IAQ67_14510 [Paenibacillus peoriae]